MMAFKLEVQGCTFYGAWLVLENGRLEVRSPYGTRQVYLGNDPASDARRALMDMIPRLEWRPS